MKTEEIPFTGIWYVAVQEIRTAGKWVREYDFAPGEWLIGFTPEGNFLETFRPEDGQTTIRRWTFDPSAGIIAITAERPESAPHKCVFDGGYLYHYDNLPHIPEDAAAIIAHHAHIRQKLVKTEE